MMNTNSEVHGEVVQFNERSGLGYKPGLHIQSSLLNSRPKGI